MILLLSLLHLGRRKHVLQNHETNTHVVQFLNIKRDKDKNKRHTQRHLGTPCLFLLNKGGCNYLPNSKFCEKCGFALDSAGCFLR